MANKHRGEVDIKLGGITYTVRPTLQNVAEIENAIGGILPFAARLARGEFKITEVIDLLYLVLRPQNGPDHDSVGEMALEFGVSNFIEPLANFIALAVSGAPTQKKPQPQPVVAGRKASV